MKRGVVSEGVTSIVIGIGMVLGLGLGGCPHPASIAGDGRGTAADRDARAYFIGAWTTSTGSYDDAAAAEDAVRFEVDGVFQTGAMDARGFVASANQGPSGPAFVARFEVVPSVGVIVFYLDGAEERAAYVIVDADRWETRAESGDEVVVVRYARRR